MPDLWTAIDTGSLAPEAALLSRLIAEADLSPDTRTRIATAGADLVRRIRADVRPGLMEVFLAEYGLSTNEGIALMCLAEALLRVPDADTMDALIEDKIAASDWGRHKGQSTSPLVNASTWALMLTGRVLDEQEPGIVGHLKAAVRRLVTLGGGASFEEGMAMELEAAAAIAETADFKEGVSAFLEKRAPKWET